MLPMSRLFCTVNNILLPLREIIPSDTFDVWRSECCLSMTNTTNKQTNILQSPNLGSSHSFRKFRNCPCLHKLEIRSVGQMSPFVATPSGAYCGLSVTLTGDRKLWGSSIYLVVQEIRVQYIKWERFGTFNFSVITKKQPLLSHSPITDNKGLISYFTRLPPNREAECLRIR